MRFVTAFVLVALLTLAGCASDEDDSSATKRPPETEARQAAGGDEPGGPAPPPDAGTASGHGADPTQVVVPTRDDTPPTASVALADRRDGRTLAEAAQPGDGPPMEVELGEPRLRGTTTGEDGNGGISTVRVSIAERVACRRADGTSFELLRRRYFPPPEVERIRARPGVKLPTRSRRSELLELAGDRCGLRARPAKVHGELWGQAINSHGLEAVTPHIPFVYVR